MAHDDDHYTLSPESIFVKAAQPKTLSTRIDEFYLGLLRVFVLMVLAATLAGAVGVGYQALMSLNEPAHPYVQSAQGSPADRFVAQMKRETAGAGASKSSAVAGANADPKATDLKADALETQLSRQFAVLSEFMTPWLKTPLSPAAFKERQRAQLDDLVISGAVSDPVAYAREQADFLEHVLKDKSIADAMRQKSEQSPTSVDEFMGKVLDYYPNLVRDERRTKLKFEQKESDRVAELRSSSASQLYVAAGLFAAFLVVCLIVVLIKIERNLRTRGDVIQVVS